MIKYFKPAAILLMALAAGCTPFDDPTALSSGQPYEGEEVTVGLLLNVSPELDEQGRKIPITRAPNDITPAEEEAIRNVWVFQFGQPIVPGNDDSRLLVWSYYISEDAINAANSGTGVLPVNLIESGAQKHLLAFVANVNDGGYGWNMTAGKNTYADLKSRNYQLNTETEESILYGDDLRNILMSGSAEVRIAEGLVIDSDTDNPAHDAGIPLTRSLAKIQLELTLGNPDYQVLSIKLHNMPNQIWFTDALNTRTDIEPRSPSLIHLPLVENVTDGLVGYQETKSFVWYVPRNTRGINPKATSVKDRNIYAPYQSTYIEITARHATTHQGVVYRIYPGADMTDFNIIPNHRYFIKQTITGNGGDELTDSRIEQFGNVRFDGNNNSFILNPPKTAGMGERRFDVPITRVNQYWAPDAQSYPGYGGLNEGIIGTNVRWRVDLLWQDDANMVRETPDELSRIWISKAEGKGPDDFFSITVPAGAKPGNFVMALRRYNPDSSPHEELQVLIDQTLWSWHFWVTDYNPDRIKFLAADGDKFVYTATGGQVERYGGSFWGYDTPNAAVSNNWNNYTFNEAGNQGYLKSFIMDRDLGTINLGTPTSSSRGLLYYQFGRKDPFVAYIALYDVNGKAITETPTTEFQAQRWTQNANATTNDVAVKVSVSVYNPMKFYCINQANWATNVDGYDATQPVAASAYAWHDPMVPTGPSSQSTAPYTGKSIYDPCPQGWKMPVPYAWEDFRFDSTYGYTVNVTGHNRGDGFASNGSGLRYWPNKVIDGKKPVEGYITYRFGGYRTPEANNKGALTDFNTVGYHWGAIPYSSNDANYFVISTSQVAFMEKARSAGMPVRCVSME